MIFTNIFFHMPSIYDMWICWNILLSNANGLFLHFILKFDQWTIFTKKSILIKIFSKPKFSLSQSSLIAKLYTKPKFTLNLMPNWCLERSVEWAVAMRQAIESSQVDHHREHAADPTMDYWINVLNRPFPCNTDMSVSFQWYTSLGYRTHGTHDGKIIWTCFQSLPILSHSLINHCHKQRTRFAQGFGSAFLGVCNTAERN